MRTLGRNVAMAYLDALETRSLARLRSVCSGEFLARMETLLRQAPDRKLEHRNLCAKSSEVIWVSERPNSYTAQVKLHAQRVVLQNGREVEADPDIRPFDLFLNFAEVSGAKRFELTSIRGQNGPSPGST